MAEKQDWWDDQRVSQSLSHTEFTTVRSSATKAEKLLHPRTHIVGAETSSLDLTHTLAHQGFYPVFLTVNQWRSSIQMQSSFKY